MNTQVKSIVAALQAHLNSANVITLGTISMREPVPHLTCEDGTVFSVQAGEMMYSSPRSNTGPWDAVEVMIISNNITPTHWETDGTVGGVTGFVPIEDVAKEILQRGKLMLTSPDVVVKTNT